MNFSSSLLVSNSILEILKNPEERSLFFIHILSIILLNILLYSYLFLKFYKVLCYTKITLDWLPVFNPYCWPFSFFRIMTQPYFKLWSRILPPIRTGKRSLEISSIVGLEALNSILYFILKGCSLLLIFLIEAEESITLAQ